jgi:hypothetical protein
MGMHDDFIGTMGHKQKAVKIIMKIIKIKFGGYLSIGEG